MENESIGWRLAAAAAMAALAGVAAAQTVPAEPANGATCSADVTVTRAILDASGRVVQETPGARYRIERRPDGRLRMTLRATKAVPASGPLADAYAGITVEPGENGRLLIRQPDGRPLAAADEAGAVLPPASPDGDLGGLFIRAEAVKERRRRLREQFGAVVGRLGSLDRYLVRRGRVVEEVLVGPETGLPVEMNILEGGALVEHHRFEYDAIPGGGFVRRMARSESAVPGTPGQRLVSVTTVADVRLMAGAR
jgi:hypothetical protein